MTKLIGITGGIGSGKTFVCNIFTHMGMPVYEADTRAKELINTSAAIIEKLISYYGKEIYNNNGIINKKKLASIIFNNKTELEKVNNIIHPVVFEDFNKWCKLNTEHKYLIHEAAILFESGIYKKMNTTVFVDAPESLRIKRVMQRDKLTKQEVEQRIKNQMPDNEKRKLANYIIINDGKTMLLPQIVKLHNIFNN